MLNVEKLTFEYDGKNVLQNVSFSVRKGSVVALVGPNGAGKTTLMRCLVALAQPVSGRILVDGLDTRLNPREVHRRTGYLSDFFGLYDRLSVHKCLLHTASCHNIMGDAQKERVEDVIQNTGLQDYRDKKAGSLSRGYRQRLGVAIATLHKPKILILDEPASGMDPEARVKLSELMLRLKAQGMTILVSSHILAELEDYCDDMLVLREGRLVDHVVYDAERPAQRRHVVVSCLHPQEKYVALLEGVEQVSHSKLDQTGFSFEFAGTDSELAEILALLVRSGVAVTGFEARKKSLQNAYMELAEKEVQK